jgi:hypothetical protein
VKTKKKDRGFLIKDRIRELMKEKGYEAVEDLMPELKNRLAQAKRKAVGPRTVYNWVSVKHKGSVHIGHAEILAEILGVELKEIYIPFEEMAEISHDDAAQGILSWDLGHLGDREPLIVLHDSIRNQFRYFYDSIDLIPLNRRGHRVPCHNRESKQYSYAVIEISRSNGKGFKGMELCGNGAFKFFWAPPFASNIVQFLTGYIQVNQGKASCFQPWTRWEDEATLTKNGNILVGYWLDYGPADFVMYHPDKKLDFKAVVHRHSDQLSDELEQVFAELLELSRYSLIEIKEQLNKLKNRQFLLFPKQAQHQHEKN